MSAHQHRIYHRLQVTAHRLKKSADRAVTNAVDLTTAQLAVLVVIAGDEPCPQRLVATRLGFNESAVTPMVRRLEQQGYVVRESAPDGRVRNLTLGSAGRDVLAAATPSFQSINDRIDAVLDPTEVAVLADLLDRLHRGLDEGAAAPDES